LTRQDQQQSNKEKNEKKKVPRGLLSRHYKTKMLCPAATQSFTKVKLRFSFVGKVKVRYIQ
jgi:hypothetical protein